MINNFFPRFFYLRKCSTDPSIGRTSFASSIGKAIIIFVFANYYSTWIRLSSTRIVCSQSKCFRTIPIHLHLIWFGDDENWKREAKKRRISSGFAAVALTCVPTTRGSFIDRICARYKLTSIVWACQSCSIVERRSQWAWLTDWPAKSKLLRRSGRWILKVLHNSSMGKPFECISLIEIPSINRHNGPYAQLGEMIFEFQCNRYAAMIC